jgi:hypothetical protein
MHLGHHEVSQQIGLAFMRHQELIAAAQQQRLFTQAIAGQSASHSAPAWRRRLGEQLVAWGEALQASNRPQYPAGSGPMLANRSYARSTTQNQIK